MEFVAFYKKASAHFNGAYKLILFVYSDSIDHAKAIVHKFYIEHYVLDGVYKSVNND